jgi:hypothetical protein
LKIKTITLESKRILHNVLQNAVLWVAESALNMSRSELSFQGNFFTSWAPNLLKRYEQKMDLCLEIPTNSYRIHSVLRIRDVYSGSRIRIFPSRIQAQRDPGSRSTSKNLNIFNPKNCLKALGILSGIFIPDPEFFSFQDLRVKKHWIRIRNTGSIKM